MDPASRLELVAPRVGLDMPSHPLALPSNSNDTWKLGDTVLRICWRGDRERLHREALLLERLPPAVPHTRLLDAGVVDDLSWTLTRVEGEIAADSWRAITAKDRDSITDQLAAALEALHRWQPDRDVTDALGTRQPPTTTEAITGADVNPLPVDRALLLIDTAKKVAFADPEVLDRLAERLDALRGVDLLGGEAGVVVHGDAHLGNIVCVGSRIVALLDFEWARRGPADLELQSLLRFDAEDHPGEFCHRLAANYPALFQAPDLVDRLWLYDLAFSLRQLIVWPPTGPASTIPAWHPLRRLPAMLEGPGYIEALLHL